MKSMTGYGAASVSTDGGRLTVEVRSVNSRFLELRIALPREHQQLETELRQIVQQSIDRGRVEVSFRRERRGSSRARVDVDLGLARELVSAWRRVGKELRLPGAVDLGFLRGSASDIVRPIDDGSEPAKDAAALRSALRKALAAHDKDRRREGVHLTKDMRARVRTLVKLRATSASLAAGIRPLLAQRLRDRVSELTGGHAIDPARLAQEVALAVDRFDVSEELSRLESHLAALDKLLAGPGAVGKRIEFLLQEVLREVNTIGSKANHLPLTEAVLDAKGQIEKLREQVANVE